jgi:hypothetical protein
LHLVLSLYVDWKTEISSAFVNINSLLQILSAASF